jgi:hypothetical protein
MFPRRVQPGNARQPRRTSARGKDVHRRVSAAIGLAVVSLGVGVLIALTKSKRHSSASHGTIRIKRRRGVPGRQERIPGSSGGTRRRDRKESSQFRYADREKLAPRSYG